MFVMKFSVNGLACNEMNETCTMLDEDENACNILVGKNLEGLT